MKQLLAFALPACLLIACSSDPAKEKNNTVAEANNETVTKQTDSPEDALPETKKLPVPELRADAELDDYGYLVKYIGDTGRKVVKKEANGMPNVWSQTFGKDITYEMLNGVESNGYHYRITFAGYGKDEVVRVVERFNGSEDMAWDKDETVYGPKEENALGCFYTVKQDKAGNYYMDCTCVC